MTVTKRKKTSASSSSSTNGRTGGKKKKKKVVVRRNNSSTTSLRGGIDKEDLYFKGCTLFDQHRSLEAIHYLKQALDLDENYVECLNAISVAYDDLREYEKVVHCLERLHSIKPIVQPDMIIFVAKSYLNYDRVDEAEMWINKVETEELDLYVDALRTKAMIYDVRGEYQRELQAFNVICNDLDAGNAQDWNNFALTYHVLLKHDEALTSILKAIDLDPQTPEWYLSEAMIRQELGNDGDLDQYQLAAISCLKVLELEQPHPLNDEDTSKCIQRTYSLLGSIYGNMKDHEESERYLRKSIEVSPDNYEAMNNLAISLMKQGKYEEAIDRVNQAIQIDPSNFDAYDTLGQIHVKLKNYETAVNFFRRAIELNPESLIALKHLEKCFKLVHEYDYDLQSWVMKKNEHQSDVAEEICSSNATLPNDIQEWSVDHVTKFIQSIGLSQYVKAFLEHEVDGTVLSKLTGAHLERMGVIKIGHQVRITEEVKAKQLSSSSTNQTNVKGEIRPS